jgi:16S rRNA (guanine966-N2)-methyltransferase
VREAVFSILGEIEGASVLDLYCGTGAMAIEALSRGAAGATLVDTDLKAATRNVTDLELGRRAALVRSDAVAFLRGRARGGNRAVSYDLVFCDPPYRLASRIEADLDSLIPARLSKGARVIVESSRRRPLALSLTVVTERRYGDTVIAVYAEGEE